MSIQRLFPFKSDISTVKIDQHLNNPFSSTVPNIARIAAEEFRDFIASESSHWEYDFKTRQGKMFGVLVIQAQDQSYAYLGGISGRLSRHTDYDELVPSVFDDSSDDYFINRGMTEVTEIGNLIKAAEDSTEIAALKERRRLKSISIQQQLFEHYNFVNLSGKESNLLEIFEQSAHGSPPSAAGECAAPKLLQYALENNLKPIALAEFWWGRSTPLMERKHNTFYPACIDKCRPILEYMLEDTELYHQRNK